MLHMARSGHLPQRALLRMPRRFTERGLRIVGQRVMPYLAQATIVKTSKSFNSAPTHVP